MANEWIFDVLADLKIFARANRLPALAEQLEQATLVAAVELASEEERASHVAQRDAGYARRLHRPAAAGGNA